MRNAASDDDLPVVAFVFRERSFNVLELARAAAGVCRLAWVLDSGSRIVETDVRLLERFGETIDVAGLADDAAAAAIAKCRPAGILAFADNLLVRTARVAEHLGLPFYSPAVAARLTDKVAQREALRSSGLAVPWFAPVPAAGDGAAWSAFLAEAVFPAVLKPRLGEASKNTVPVSSAEDLERVLDEMFDDARERPPMVLEEFMLDLPGAGGPGFASYASAESFVSAGRIQHLAVTGRTPQLPPFRETGAIVPCALAPADQTRLLELASAAITALGVTIGSLHTEVKLTPDGPRIIEVNGRIGGIVDVVEGAMGVDPRRLAFEVALGREPAIPAKPAIDGVAYLLCLYAPEGARRVVSASGLDTLRTAVPGIAEVEFNSSATHSLDWREGSDTRVVNVRGVAADLDEVRHLMALLPEAVELRVE